MITIDVHELLDAGVFATEFGAPLGDVASTDAVRELLARTRSAPFTTDDDVKKAVRDLLRRAGYRPTGRGKPASEYLCGVASEGPISSINFAVDACNAVSLHSGLPISVVDLDRARPPFRIGVAAAGESYPFNVSGQTIELEGLLCLFDAEGPCANAVKDSQRTKTNAGTRHTLSVVWGTRSLADRTARVVAWYRELLAEAGARTQSWAPELAPHSTGTSGAAAQPKKREDGA